MREEKTKCRASEIREPCTQYAKSKGERLTTSKPGGSATQEPERLANNQPSAARGSNTIKLAPQGKEKRARRCKHCCLFFWSPHFNSANLKFQATRLSTSPIPQSSSLTGTPFESSLTPTTYRYFVRIPHFDCCILAEESQSEKLLCWSTGTA